MFPNIATDSTQVDDYKSSTPKSENTNSCPRSACKGGGTFSSEVCCIGGGDDLYPDFSRSCFRALGQGGCRWTSDWRCLFPFLFIANLS